MEIVKAEVFRQMFRVFLADGTDRVYLTPADALIGIVLEKMGLPTHGGKGAILRYAGIQNADLSRARKGLRPIRTYWLLPLHEMSGIPVAQLRMAAGLPAAEPFVFEPKEMKDD